MGSAVFPSQPGLAIALFGPRLVQGLPDGSQGKPRFRDFSGFAKLVGVLAIVAGFVNLMIMDGTLPI